MTWLRQAGRTGSINTGPNNDHTFGNIKGHYMYIETSWKKKNDTARWGLLLFFTSLKGNIFLLSLPYLGIFLLVTSL